MNKLFLFLLMLPKFLWRGLGADVDQLQAILDVKLKMDDRKPLGFNRPQSKKKPAKYTSTLTFIFTLITGIVYIFPLFVFNDTMMALFGFYTMMLVLLTFMLITDFSNVLIDTRDKLIIFPKPVDDRTILLSRMLHILIYFFRTVLPMSIPSWVAWGLMKGWLAAIWFPIPILLLTFMCLFFVIGCYLLLLRLSRPERFKDIIGYFQIVFSVVIFACYYLMPRATGNEMLQHMTSADYPWIRFVPSYWLAACWTWVEPTSATLAGTAWLSIAAILFPLVAVWFTVKFLAPSFIRKIAAIDGVEVEASKKVTRQSKSKLYNTLANLLNKNDAAKAGFILTWLQTGRSRTFKMRVYPSFAYIIVYFFYILLQSDKPFAEVWQKLPKTKSYLMLLYMSSFAIMNAINYVTISEQYKAAWVYYTSPVNVPGNILGGAFKAMWIKYYFPFAAFVGIFVIYIWGPLLIVDILLAMINVTIFALIILYISNKHLPFSIAEQLKTNAGKSILKVLFAFGLIGGLGAGHYFLPFLWLKIIVLGLSGVFLWMVWDSYYKTDWRSIKMAEDAI